MRFISIIVLLFISFQSYSQLGIECIENKGKAKKLLQEEEISNDKILFVFDSDENIDVIFEGNGSNIERENGIVKLYIPSDGEYGTNGTINLTIGQLKHTLNFGNINGAINPFRSVNSGEKIWFDVFVKKNLKLYADSEKNGRIHRKGHGLSDNYAIVQIVVKPYNIDISFKEEPYIILDNDQNTSAGVYNFLVKPNLAIGSFITIIKESYIEKKISVSALNPKEPIYYILKDENVGVGKYLIESEPSGASVIIKDNKYVKNESTPFLYDDTPGKHPIVLKKKGYKDFVGFIDVGSPNTRPFVLEPKLAYLTIPIKQNNRGAEVYIDNKMIGEIPIKNYPILEGVHHIKFYKDSYLSNKPSYMINVEEDEKMIFDSFKLSHIKKIRIVTKPKNRAKVYIDGRLQSSKTDFNVKLSVGVHNIRIVKNHYKVIEESFVVDEQKDTHVFYIKRDSYRTVFDTTPTSEVFVDGIYKGTTPQSVYLTYGWHKVKYKEKGIMTESHKYFINESGEKFHSKLYPSDIAFLGATYGVGQISFELGGSYSRFFIAGSLVIPLQKNPIEVNELTIHNVEVVDIDSYGEEFARVYPDGADNESTGLGLKLGFLFRKPFPFIITGGGVSVITDKFYKVHKAKNNYESNGTIVLPKGDLFSEKELVENKYHSLSAGIIIPLFRTIYESGENYTQSELGAGIVVGVGFILM